ncbi:mannosyltransferase [Hamiltosporidium tvaerminnensis]|uniref:GPI mannosyltransferase 2 n=1 Tax=Hamiltosporidium tvaerminnensis TaxID=1176355 RepID=A0A4Q9KW75_9MICR|nr:mannosyltransferase [Hamiltosporidium tvaerminnensis]
MVIFLSFLSRILYLSITYISSLIFTPYDRSTSLADENNIFEFMLRWDALYFNEICKNGYYNEHMTAFLPLYPYMVKEISKIFKISCLSAGILLNNTIFILNSIILYKITSKRYNERMAFLSSIFYIFNPASVIYSSTYSECIFMFLFLIGFYFLENRNFFKSFFFFGLCGMCRSNAVLFNVFVFFLNIKYWLGGLLLINIFFGLVQGYWYLKINPGENIIFIPYSYIQKKYWEQGFLRFYTFKKNIPNIFVGFPFLVFCLIICFRFLKNNFTNILNKSYSNQRMRNTTALVLILVIQCIITILFLHWNMFYRFVSYNPFIYWALVSLYEEYKDQMWFLLLMFGYFNFSILYCILFGSYYPPA